MEGGGWVVGGSAYNPKVEHSERHSNRLRCYSAVAFASPASGQLAVRVRGDGVVATWSCDERWGRPSSIFAVYPYRGMVHGRGGAGRVHFRSVAFGHGWLATTQSVEHEEARRKEKRN